jgi:hypothetical protein
MELMAVSVITNEVEKVASDSNWFLRNATKTLDFITKVGKFDVSKYLTNFVKFVDTNFPDIVSYYKLGVNASQEAFNTFEFLWRQAGEVDAMIENYENVFVNCEVWVLVDHFSEVQRKLETIKNMGRWTRSSRLDRYSSTIKMDYIQNQGESFEQISRKTGNIDYDNSWVQLAIQNDINEEKYTSAGGTLLSISFANNASFDLRNIVDNLSSTNIYGKDLVKKFTITAGDISVLTGWDALLQTFGTILSTIKGGIPEFPEDGTSNNAIGSNVNTIGFPSIFRNLLAMIQKDDRFSSLDLVDVRMEEDSVFMTVKAKTKIGQSLTSNILL